MDQILAQWQHWRRLRNGEREMPSARYTIPVFHPVLALSILLSLSGIPEIAYAEQGSPQISTREYKSRPDKERLVFVAGMLDSLAIAGRATDDHSRLSKLDRCHDSKPLIAVVAGYEMWMLDQYDGKWEDWERWADPATDTFFDYLADSCKN